MRTQTQTELYRILLRLLVPGQRMPEATSVGDARMPPALRWRTESIAELGAHEGVVLPHLGVTPIFSGHRVYVGRDCDWVLMPLAEDPLYHDRDGYPLPSHILTRLKALCSLGLEFDSLYIAHETPPDAVSEGRPIDPGVLMPPAPRAVRQLTERLGAIAQGGWRVSAAPLLASGVIAGAALSAPAIGLGAILDPVLFGAVVAPGRSARPGEPASWFLLAAWNYGEE